MFAFWPSYFCIYRLYRTSWLFAHQITMMDVSSIETSRGSWYKPVIPLVLVREAKAYGENHLQMKSGLRWRCACSRRLVFSSVELLSQFNARGVVAMANSGVDTNKSQFFIVYSKQSHLDGKYTIFGKVIDGADSTLDAMERVPVVKNRPVSEIKLTHVRLNVTCWRNSLIRPSV